MGTTRMPQQWCPGSKNGLGTRLKPSEKPFPMNSRRLTVPYLMYRAKAIGLPTKGTADETRVMIDRKLTEMGRDPHTHDEGATWPGDSVLEACSSTPELWRS